MWLITGGAYQGKLEYAMQCTGIKKEDIADGAICDIEEIMKKPMVNCFHLWIARMLKDEQDVMTLVEKIMKNNPHIVFVVDELGCGIVPINSFDRMYRETTGRICCRIASRAKCVHRVICGVGVVIKND
ncbi:bifunctional adenosylcobinamide kinase/adenosylcobinamide-phosphate guanylyltransferase [Anaeromicropila populeti]|uniref:Adenosylcobinamide kinase n=1 Tax=Anaeromicropila populeti TaxID=37658 RepID=A0A1I6J187_9FIRM|nr:bifunctional adenosylcobinamide kinase/adenosylcobinamide-phosphate guanylyltransferase [Anaeromicropila populeti]SFR72631.1 adenosylcobinamide kinase /adenosylcobinamide-phosphate guanylyltransferase [Anaeromicropila populeti]